jgi:hypothetical protein
MSLYSIFHRGLLTQIRWRMHAVPTLKTGSRAVQKSEPDPEPYLSPTSGRAWVGLKNLGLGRART